MRNHDDARKAFFEPAYEERAEWTDDALNPAIDETSGYPYFIQELGPAVRGVAEKSPIVVDDVERSIDLFFPRLDESFFRVRLDRATPLQVAYLRVMAELGPGPQKASAVAEVMGRNSKSLGLIRSKLINMGLLYTPPHGHAEFTVPHFDKLMVCEMPELVPLPKCSRKKWLLSGASLLWCVGVFLSFGFLHASAGKGLLVMVSDGG